MRALSNQLDNDSFSFEETVGGWRGLVESLAPGLIFVVTYLLTNSLQWPLILSSVVAVVATIVRLVQRQSITQVFSGLLGVGIGVVWVWKSGRAEDYFAMGLWTNGAYFTVFLGSILLRRPIIGWVIAGFKRVTKTWRSEELRQFYLRSLWATYAWMAMFVLRSIVQIPLYLDGNVAWLGTARLVMGIPLTALVCWITWVLLRKHIPGKSNESSSDTVESSGNTTKFV